MKIKFIRHGATPGNLRKAYIGKTDESLSPMGISALCPSLLRPVEIYVSPKLRCKETADILFPNIPQKIIFGLEEMDFGDFEGKNYEDLGGNIDYQQWVEGKCLGICPNGEGRENFIRRCVAAFSKVIEATDEDCIFVVHGGTIMAICSVFVPKSDYFQWQISCGGSLDFLWTGTQLERL